MKSIIYDGTQFHKYLRLDSSRQDIWFTSDTHFGHSEIIKYAQRPFENVEEMNNILIQNWNSVVRENDIIFHLGDFGFLSRKFWYETVSKLNGQKHLILGNHDLRNWPSHRSLVLFESVNQQAIIKIDNRKVILNHYPLLCFDGMYKDYDNATFNLFGHVHSNPNIDLEDSGRLQYLCPFHYDVGVDNNNYYPISWEDIKLKIRNQYEQSNKTPN